MKNFTLAFIAALLISLNVMAQKSAPVKQEQLQVTSTSTVNFQQLAEYEKAHPVILPQRDMEKDEDDESHKAVPNHNKIDASAVVTTVDLAAANKTQTRAASPAPTVTFNGLIDNSTVIPPDVNGAAGPNHIMETINSQFAIFSKTGTNLSTITITNFFSATGASSYYDPHIEYDPYNQKWLIVMAATLSNTHAGFVLAASQTSDPTGNWFEYTVDAQGTTTNWMDYPTMGFNNNWVVVCGNMFTKANSFANSVVFVFNKTGVYSGSTGTVNKFSDAGVFTLQPAVTYDNALSTLYMVTDWNGNSGGNGYVRLYTITGAVASPVYTAGSTIGVNQPWSENSVGAPQLGSTKTITTNDARVMNSVYRNGSLYCAQAAFLPVTSPKRSAVQWWQINPANSTVVQFGRVDDATAATFYAFPSISVNANNDVLLGYAVFNKTFYASAGYSFRTASDPVNTMKTNLTFKSGQSSYFKTYSGTTNRWGDYTFTSVDPVDNSLWTIQEFAYTPANQWGTVWANVAASSAVTCGVSSGLNATNLTNNAATLNWTIVSGASSYNVQYRIVGTSTWSPATSATNSLGISSLTASSNYEFQVQTVCTGGSSAFTASGTFTTLAPPCSVASSLNATNVTNNSATLNWIAVSGASSYNVQYRIAGTSTWSPATSATNSLNIGSLTASSNYEFQVQTVCSVGSSAFTSSGTFTTLAPPCSVTSGLSATNITTVTATLNWGAVSNAVDYNVQYRIVGTSPWSTGASATATLDISGLTSASNYEFQVQTVCSSNLSAFSASGTFTTSSVSCGLSANLNATNVTYNSATLNWDAVSGANSYNVQYRITGTTTWTNSSGTVNALNVAGLTASSNYEFQVQTVCSGGNSAFTPSANFTTPAPPCNVPSGLSATNVTSSSATLNWGAVSFANSYNVQYRIVGTLTWSNTSGIVNTLNIAGLTASSNYEFQVQTVCSGGSSSFSGSGTFTTPAPPCNIPSSLAASAITTTTATAGWGAVSGAVSYTLQYKVSTSSTWTTISGITGVSRGLTGLTAASTYNLQVQTVCSANTSAFSSVVSFTTSSGTVSYCTDKGTSQSFEYIKGVAFGSFSNVTGSNTGYGNFTNLTIPITSSGAATTFTLTPGYTSSTYNEYFVIYIDYNGNGVFTDAGEKVYVSGAAKAAINGTFTVPTGLNITTRMRVIMQYGAAVTSPCGTYTYGETEDYTVNLSPTNPTNSPASGAPVINDDGSVSVSLDNLSRSIYPNPTSHIVNIPLSQVENVQPQIQIIDVTGQTIISYLAGDMDREASIDVSHLPSGVYLVRTLYGNERVSTEKLIKE